MSTSLSRRGLIGGAAAAAPMPSIAARSSWPIVGSGTSKLRIRAAILTVAACGGMLGQQVASVSIDDYRPMAKALVIVERKTGIPINFEEPRYESDADIEMKGSFRGPKKGRLNVQVNVGSAGVVSAAQMPTASLAVSKVLQESRSQGLPGRFVIRNTGNEVLTVVPTHLRGASGADRVMTPLSDAFLYPMAARGSVGSILNEAVRRVTGATGYKILIGDGLPATIALKRAEIPISESTTFGTFLTLLLESASSMPAVEGNSESQAIWAWQILFEPHARTYYLNFRRVMREVPLRSANEP